jgi:mRNA interferase MazF
MARASRVRPAIVIQRGSVWWVDLDPTRGTEIRKMRPAVVLSADGLNRARRTVVIVPLSTGPEAHPPIAVATRSVGEGAVAVCDQLRAVDKTRLTRIAGTMSRADLRLVEDGVRAVLQL